MVSTVRHAVAHSTGATTWVRKVADGTWKITCLNHKATTVAPTRNAAWVVGSHPQDFCGRCAEISKGKAEKIARGRLGIPGRKAAAQHAA